MSSSPHPKFPQYTMTGEINARHGKSGSCGGRKSIQFRRISPKAGNLSGSGLVVGDAWRGSYGVGRSPN